MANSYRRKGTRISALVGSDGDIGLAPAISLGVHTDGAGRERLKVLARVGPGMFTERNYDLRAVRDYVSSAEDCPAEWQASWAEIEAEVARREATK